jgi:hypothetical protein
MGKCRRRRLSAGRRSAQLQSVGQDYNTDRQQESVMRRLLLAAVVGSLAAAEARAEGWPPHYPPPNPEYHGWGPHTTSVTWPSIVPPGWYTNTYNYRWFYPWFAYYNYSAGPYANWPATGGYAGYAYHGPAGMYQSHKQPAQPYIGAWYRGSAGGSFSALQGLTTAPSVPSPMPEKKDDTGGTNTEPKK